MGHWKDFEELESALSMPELMVTLNAIYEREKRSNRFHAAIAGIELDDHPQEDSSATTLEEVYARAKARAQGRTVTSEEISFDGTGIDYEVIGLNG